MKSGNKGSCDATFNAFDLIDKLCEAAEKMEISYELQPQDYENKKIQDSHIALEEAIDQLVAELKQLKNDLK